MPGEIKPGQLGPNNLEDVFCFKRSYISASSFAGIPSVIQTINSQPAYAASKTASLANGGGTKVIAVFAPVSSIASSTVLKIGIPSTVSPPLPGLVPATTFVPYALFLNA